MSALLGELVPLAQPRGPEIRLRVTGDEFYAVYETAAGYTAADDGELGLFCHAALEDGALVSSGVPLSEPPPAGTPRHLREAPDVRTSRREAQRRRHDFRRALQAPVMPSGRGLLPGRRVSDGEVRGLVMLLEFQDVRCKVRPDEVSALFNGEDYRGHGNACSVHDYFRRVSSGRLDYAADVIGPFRLGRERAFYAGVGLVGEAFDILDALGIDLRRYDSRGEGFADAISLMYAGPVQYRGALWPHVSWLGLRRGDVVMGECLVAAMGASSEDLRVGTLCHETGHLLCRFPDLYDGGDQGDGDAVFGAGLGQYCLMGCGNHLSRERTPPAVSAYLRVLVGWCGRELALAPGAEMQAVHGDYDTVLRFGTAEPGEYFLVENRCRLGLDIHLPASGLAVYHCDTRPSGGDARHGQCVLLQADGKSDLEHSFNSGDEADLFFCVDGIALSRDTVPSTRLWSGEDSGLVIQDVGMRGGRMGFRVGAHLPRVEGEAAPGQPISRAVVPSRIAVAREGSVGRMRVVIDITQAVQGYLILIAELTAPSGHKFRVPYARGGGVGPLQVRVDSADELSPLHALAGEPMQGHWSLVLTDLGPRGHVRGSFDKWSLAIEPVPDQRGMS